MDCKEKIVTYGEVFEEAYKQIEECVRDGDYAVLCADHHIGYSMPIGGVVAYKDYISPSGVGFDIACGNKAVMTDLQAEDIEIKKIMDEIVKRIGFGLARPNPEPIDHPVIDKIAQSDFKPQRNMFQLARSQLGTVGAGNHYVDLFSDEEGRLWVGVHFGSRGFGHKTAMGFLALARGMDFTKRPKDANSMNAPPTLLKTNSSLGEDYIEAMKLAGEYAYAGRDAVVNKVLEILGAKEMYTVHNHHNFAWQEKHYGENYWVIRKGCTPAFPGQQSFIGSTMGEESVIVEGIDNKESRKALYSTVHGAGRVMSRTKAAGAKRWKKKKGVLIAEYITPGEIDFKTVKEKIRQSGIELRGGGADEAPEAYKRLDEVLEFHKNTIKILHRLKPIGVAMAGENVYDPYID
jgi:tRNA-splicing ligase RtcB